MTPLCKAYMSYSIAIRQFQRPQKLPRFRRQVMRMVEQFPSSLQAQMLYGQP